uniref:Uncharacterized protein n=1 Tax=Romanomermis culicivorax TaxID=13658 RepID=A0A915I621_ROMCU
MNDARMFKPCLAMQALRPTHVYCNFKSYKGSNLDNVRNMLTCIVPEISGVRKTRFLLNFESNERFLIEKFSIWTRYLKLEMDKCDVALSIMKIGENLLQMVVITENDTRSYDYQALKQFVDLLLVRIQHQIGDGGIVQESIKILGFSENVKNSAATISLCLLIILIVGIFIGYWKRENIRNLFIRERVNLTAFWGSDKASEPQRDDRMLLEFSHETGASSSTLSVISSSNIKSLKTPKLDLVAPKKFKAFFGSKKRCTSSTSGESPLEMRYPKKQLSVIDSAREMSSATTFTNPMFDKNYSLEFDE